MALVIVVNLRDSQLLEGGLLLLPVADEEPVDGKATSCRQDEQINHGEEAIPWHCFSHGVPSSALTASANKHANNTCTCTHWNERGSQLEQPSWGTGICHNPRILPVPPALTPQLLPPHPHPAHLQSGWAFNLRKKVTPQKNKKEAWHLIHTSQVP